MPNLVKIAPVASGPASPAAGQPARIALQFDTGESFEISALDLRYSCPCASCVDEMTGKRTLRRESLKPDVRPTQISPVGNYGIHVQWSDGHRTGMYHFDNLYHLAKAHPAS